MGRKFDWYDRMRLENVKNARGIRLGKIEPLDKREYNSLICNICNCQHYRYRYISERKKTPTEIKRGEF